MPYARHCAGLNCKSEVKAKRDRTLRTSCRGLPVNTTRASSSPSTAAINTSARTARTAGASRAASRSTTTCVGIASSRGTRNTNSAAMRARPPSAIRLQFAPGYPAPHQPRTHRFRRLHLQQIAGSSLEPRRIRQSHKSVSKQSALGVRRQTQLRRKL